MTEKQTITPDAIESVEANPDLHFLTYADLVSRRIVGSRTQLMRLQRTADFPRPMRIGGRAVFSAQSIREYIAARVAAGKVFACATGAPKPLSPRVCAMLAEKSKM